jgi:alpha-L-rhamnosidase
VRVWSDKDVQSNWSRPQKWEVGLPTARDWQSSVWIGREGPNAANPAPFLRKDFAIQGKVRRARIYASGLAYADIHLNGKCVNASTERDPGYTNFDKRVLYVAYDVTAQLKEGKNAIGAVLGTGWYDVHDLATWRFERAPWRGRPRLRLLLAVDYADGRTEFIPSDTSWRATTGPILTDGIYTGETYDARKELPGWDQAGFDDRSWQSANELPAPKGKLVALRCPPVAITETFAPTKIAEPKPGVFVVDFGQNFSGHARLKLKGPAGTKVVMRYSERVGKDGMIERAEIDHFMTKADPPQPFQTDTYICKGEGTETWEQRFSYSGFRYMEVTGFPGRPAKENFLGCFAHTGMESAGAFECSNELFNKIQRATRYSYLSNAQSIPTDCPQREKNGWTGDAHLAAEAGLMNFRSESFYTKWLNDFADDQTEDGKVGVIVPSGGWGHGAFNPAWDSAYPIIADDLYEYRGDLRVFGTHYDHLRRYVDALAAKLDAAGILKFDSLGDWVPWDTETPSTFTSTAFLYLDLKIVSKAAKLLGKLDDAKKYDDLALSVQRGFNNNFYEELAPGASAIDTQTASAIALYFGLTPDYRREKVLDSLIKNIERQGHLDTGILGAKYVLRVLSEAGRTDLAYKLVNRREQPGWGWWIDQGATTLWEDWKGESSLNHIMFGDVSNWFFQWIAGIRQSSDSPGFDSIVIEPHPIADLTWARATYDSPHGRFVCSWHKVPKGLQLDVVIPANTQARLSTPGYGLPTEHGRHIGSIPGVGFGRVSAARPEVFIASGSYSFFLQEGSGGGFVEPYSRYANR